MGPHGSLYGTASLGGAGYGVVYQISPPSGSGSTWTEAVLYSFTGGDDGSSPSRSVVDLAGSLYGVTPSGGSARRGVVFQLSPPANGGTGAWIETVLYAFTQPGDGRYPNGTPIVHNGVIYGDTVTGAGADNQGGTVFELRMPSEPGGPWTEEILHSFSREGYAGGRLVLGIDGYLYGTLSSLNCCGTVYRVGP